MWQEEEEVVVVVVVVGETFELNQLKSAPSQLLPGFFFRI
jgi:hypothetical protein